MVASDRDARATKLPRNISLPYTIRDELNPTNDSDLSARSVIIFANKSVEKMRLNDLAQRLDSLQFQPWSRVSKTSRPLMRIGTWAYRKLELNPPMAGYLIQPALSKVYGQAEYYLSSFFSMKHI